MLVDYIIFTRQPISKVPTYLMEFKVFIMHFLMQRLFACVEDDDYSRKSRLAY